MVVRKNEEKHHPDRRIAVIDLGTNTFNLLIAELTHEYTLRFLHRERRPVFLGRNGIEKNLIAQDAMERAWKVLREYKELAQQHRASKILAYGTSAIRTAHNADQFNAKAQALIDAPINVIEGSEEAQLIYLGVRQSIEPTHETFLIVDIGGGSNELILANSETIFWKKSYPIGMARVKAQFTLSDPITTAEINQLNNYFATALADFLHTVHSQYSIQKIVGAEGAFESFLHIAEHIPCSSQSKTSKSILHSHELSLDCFNQVKEKLIVSTLNERLNMKGLEPFRAEMIVPAVVFVDFLLEKLQYPQMFISEYSLKEGVAWNYFFPGNEPG